MGKLSNFDSEKGIIGHECVNEIIVDRMLTLLGVEHLAYQLIHANIEIDGKIFETWVCASEDFKERGETKAALDNYYQINASAWNFARLPRNGAKTTMSLMKNNVAEARS